MTKLNDATLLAFVDGELESDASHEVAKALETDPEAREKVHRLRRSAVLVRTVFDQVPEQEMSPGLRALLEPKPPREWRRTTMAIAASILIAAVGFGGGFLAASLRTPVAAGFDERLFDEIADYHTMYAREDEHQVEVSAAQPAQIEQWLGNRLHRRLHIPDLSNRTLTFIGARLFVVDGMPVAQFIYHWPGQPHRPLGLCISIGAGDEPLRADSRDGVQQVLWRHQGYTYVLVGWTSREVLNSIAAEVMPKLAKDLS
jgi:anti-sigma factor RsiW